jgi:hypothetical protein
MGREDPPVQLVDILRADFRTSRDADATSTELQRVLALPYRYHPARLALGLSLADPAPPPPPADLLGRPIKGETLFGHEENDLALWTGLLVEHAGTVGVTKRHLQDGVAAHWQRGTRLLWARWERHEGEPHLFYAHLVGELAAG